MRRYALSALIVMLMLLAARPASAQAKQGDREVLVQGQTFTTVGGTSTFTFGQGIFNIGQFLSDLLEVGGGPSLQISGGGGGGTDIKVGANGFLRRYFRMTNPKIAPFVAGEVFEQDFGNAGDFLFINGVGGLKNYLSEKTALEISGSYGFNASSASTGIIQFKVGVTFLF